MTSGEYSYALKPVSSTRTLYVPGWSARIAEKPPSVVTVLAETFVAVLVAVTDAPGITAPELSVTVPVRTPRSDWGYAGNERQSSTPAERNGCRFLIQDPFVSRIEAAIVTFRSSFDC